MIDGPVVSKPYYDAQGRQLQIEVIDLRNPLGREVRGKIRYPTVDGWNEPTPYSCSLEIWKWVWRDGTPPADRRTFKDG